MQARAQRATFAALVVVSALGFALPAPGREDPRKSAPDEWNSGAWSLPAPESCKAPRAGAAVEDAAGLPFRTGLIAIPAPAGELQPLVSATFEPGR